MIFFNLFTIAALAIWTPTPWWMIAILFFFWAILDYRVGLLKDNPWWIKFRGRKK